MNRSAFFPLKKIPKWLCLWLLILLSGCGASNNTNLNPLNPGQVSTQNLTTSLSPTLTQFSSGQPNVLPIYVDGGISGQSSYANGVFTTVTVCMPNSTQCNTIDHVLVDTGSVGLRLLASTAGGELTLPLPTITESGYTLYECLDFADGYSWGSVNQASVQLGQEHSTTIPVQVIGVNTQLIPAYCSNSAPQNTPENDLSSLSANGILGVGIYPQDCGPNLCIPDPYYACTTTSCNPQPITARVADQVANPVSALAQDNNGIILELPAISDLGAPKVTGQMILGVNTRTNNTFPAALFLTLNDQGYFGGATWNGSTFSTSYVDSGTSVLEVGQTLIPTCTTIGFDCPSSTMSFQVALSGANGATQNINFNIDNATMLFNQNPSYNAFNNLGASAPDNNTLVLGLPFFYGNEVAEQIGSFSNNVNGSIGFSPLP